MILSRSRFIHTLPLSDSRSLIIHAVSQFRVAIDPELADLLSYFDEPRELDEAVPALVQRFGYDQQTVLACVSSLYEKGILSDKTPDQQTAEIAAGLGELHGRDPGELLDHYRRGLKQGPEPYWAVSSSRGIADEGGFKRRLDVLLFGDCDVQIESDFLRRAGAARGIDIRVAATFPDDLQLASEQAHDAIVIGALRARASIATAAPDQTGDQPYRFYIAQAYQILTELRTRSNAPILLDNLPEPTVQPLGFADRGAQSHRNRYKAANLALEQLAESFTDVYIVDVAAKLAGAGAERLLDDGLVSFTHFGSPGWMLQRPESEKAAVHNIFPDVTPLAQTLGGDPYGREGVVAEAHMDMLSVVIGIDRKKCVIVDLDGTLWPGVLAETGQPFAWHPDISGPFSYVGLFFGIHEALRTLKSRGIVLAAASKNDEATVRELWKYPEHYPHERLLTPDDFVTWRVNWQDKPTNIQSIADELGFALDTFLFIDDNPVERERVRHAIPSIEVWGEDLFAVRRKLLTDPRLSLPRMTDEAGVRTELVKAQLNRTQLRAQMVDEGEFIASLDINSVVEQLEPGSTVDRVQELFERTTQFNTTNRKFQIAELQALLEQPDARIFTLKVSDRFGDHGLVGAAVVQAGEILCYALSCRVIGLGVDQVFLKDILGRLAETTPAMTARIIKTARNVPARNLYRDQGFTEIEEGLWHKSLAA
jgi:FkbH-like protein